MSDVLLMTRFFVIFFFSSRRRHTRFDCDWSSDVCSSDLDFSAADQSRSLLPSRSSLFNIPDAWSSCGKLRYWGPRTRGHRADDGILEADELSEYRAVE